MDVRYVYGLDACHTDVALVLEQRVPALIWAMTPWKKKLAAKKIREEKERAKYAAARQAEMDRRAVAKAKEKERMEAMMEARRRKKEEIAGLKTPGALSEGARAVSTPKARAKRVGFAED